MAQGVGKIVDHVVGERPTPSVAALRRCCLTGVGAGPLARVRAGAAAPPPRPAPGRGTSPGRPARRCRATCAERCRSRWTIDDPSRGSVSLAVMEHPVPQSKGVIVFNPGGPGESGVLILPILASLMPQARQGPVHLRELRRAGNGVERAASLRAVGRRGGQRHRRDGGRDPDLRRSGALLPGQRPHLVPDREHHDIGARHGPAARRPRGRSASTTTACPTGRPWAPSTRTSSRATSAPWCSTARSTPT